MRSNAGNRPNHVVAWGVGIIIFCVGAGFGFFSARLMRPHVAAERTTANRRDGQPRPWGEMESLRIPLADHEKPFPDRDERLRPSQWFFKGSSQAEVVEFLNSCGLDESLKSALFKAEWLIASNGLICLPPDKLVRGLSGVTRAKIYNRLGEAGENYSQRFPFCFTPAEFEHRLDEDGLPRDKLDFVKSLAYTNDGVVFFSDLQILSKEMTSEEFDRTVAAFYEIPTYRLRLRLYRDSKIEPIVQYWGRGGREHRIRPILESLTALNRENGASLNVSYLLPSFCRLRLYTFPESWPEAQKSREDCFWTSMNFFNETPDMRFLNSENVRQSLREDFEIIKSPSDLGDIIALMGANGNLAHVCVFLADDFVFTKNGMNTLQPWVIMKIQDMTASFAAQKASKLVFFRRKDIAIKTAFTNHRDLKANGHWN